MNKEILNTAFFKKHYIFWVDDEGGASAAESLFEILGPGNLFNASIARGIYSSLQVLNAIKTKIFNEFDLGIIDVKLDKSKYFFKKVVTYEDTMPTPLSSLAPSDIYENTIDDTIKLTDFARFDGFNFDPDSIKNEAGKVGGLFVWAWANQVCKNATFVIHSAQPTLITHIDFLKMAGVLDICEKGKLERIKDVQDYLKYSGIADKTRDFVERLKNDADKISKVNFVNFNPKSSYQPLREVYETDIPVEFFSTVRRRGEYDDACVVHSIDENENGELTVLYEVYSDLKERSKFEKPYFINKLNEIIENKILRGEVSVHDIRTIINTKGLWKVQIEDKIFEQVPFFLTPVGGEIDEIQRVITLSEKQASKTYLFVTFFLPWAKELLNDDPVAQQNAVSEIDSLFLSNYPLATDLLFYFCDSDPFHSLIEGTTLYHTHERAEQALSDFKCKKLYKYLTNKTAETVTGYLENKDFCQWAEIKSKLELYPGDLSEFITAQIPKEGYTLTGKLTQRERDKTYCDRSYIEDVLKIALDNILRRAFSDSASEKKIWYEIDFFDNPARLVIKIGDNGKGFNVSILRESNSSYSKLFKSYYERNFLNSYGKLYIESQTSKFEVHKDNIAPLNDKVEGTVVTLEILRPS